MIIKFKKRENLTIERDLLQELWYALNRITLSQGPIHVKTMDQLDHVSGHMVKALDLLRALDKKENR